MINEDFSETNKSSKQDVKSEATAKKKRGIGEKFNKVFFSG